MADTPSGDGRADGGPDETLDRYIEAIERDTRNRRIGAVAAVLTLAPFVVFSLYLAMHGARFALVYIGGPGVVVAYRVYAFFTGDNPLQG